MAGGILLFALAGRLFDVVSTHMLTPKLALEGNSVVRRVGWLYAWASIALAIPALWYPSIGIMIGTASCLMGWSNMSFVLLARHGVGEQGLASLHAKAIHDCSIGRYLTIQLLQFLPLLTLALAILCISGFAFENRASDVGYGILAWLLSLAAHKSKVVIRKWRARGSNGAWQASA